MLQIPTRPVPSQFMSVTLANQLCRINLYQKTTGLYMDLYSNGSLVIGGVICQNWNRIVRDSYLGFVGDFIIEDTAGVSDPDYTGLGSRYQLIYLEAGDALLTGDE